MVRSKQLALASGGPTSGFQTVYTCPSDTTAILKDFSLNTSSTGGDPLAIAVLKPSSGDYALLLDDEAPPATNVYRQSGTFVVMEPGDELQVYVTTGAWSLLASGAELDGTAP